MKHPFPILNCARMVLPILALSSAAFAVESPRYTLTILPPEQKVMNDPETGAKLTFITTDTGKDTNLYFHERSWTADGSVVLFYSSRNNGGLMGYLVKTGELFTFQGTEGNLGGATAASTGNGLFALKGRDIVRVDFEISASDNPVEKPSVVTAIEQHIATLPAAERFTPVGENCAGTTLSVGVQDGETGPVPAILTIDVASGAVKELCRAPESPGVVQHVQWSHTDPEVLSYAGATSRLMVVNTRDGNPKAVYHQWEGELVTHESWWVDDQILFCGGTHTKPTENSHVKVFDTKTGVVRIIGAGSWWAGGTPEEISKYNWWHADGSDDGRWVVADNWHGDIILFEGKTTRPRMLTLGHRTYGEGSHPHVGFDRAGKSVIFTSHLLGDENVCIAEIPDAWQRENPS